MSDQAEVAATASPGATAAPRQTVPVVGMIGAGQLARMTSQAATGLGIGFRVLAASPADSAALVCQGTQVGDYRSADDLAAFAVGCDVVTFDHEQVPPRRWPGWPGPPRRPAQPGRAQVHPGQAGLREWLTARGIACRVRASQYRHGRRGVRGAALLPVVLKAVSGGYDGRGVWVCGDAGEAAAVLAGASARGIALLAEQHVAFARELAALVARSPAKQGAAYPVVQTVQRGGICREVLAPAPGLAPGRAAEAQLRPCGWRPSWTSPGARGGAVRDRGRPAGQRAGHAPAQLRALDLDGSRTRSSSSTCGRAEPAAGRPSPTAPAAVMVNVLAATTMTCTTG